MRKLRYMKRPYTVFEVTMRTIQGRFLLRPSRMLNKLILGALGRALKMHPGMRVYGIKVMSNHIHILLSGPDQTTFSEFMSHFSGNVARIAGNYHGWHATLWARRYTALSVEDRGSLFKSTRYLIENSCKEGLVASPLDWPGIGSERALAFGEKLEGVWYDNTEMNKATRRGETVDPEDYATRYEIPLHPSPLVEDMSPQQARQFYLELIKDVEQKTAEHYEKKGGQPLGPEAILTQDPWASPRHFIRRPAPACHASSQRTRKKFIRRYKWFVELYRQAMERLRSNDIESDFPEGGCLPNFMRSRAGGTSPAFAPG